MEKMKLWWKFKIPNKTIPPIKREYKAQMQELRECIAQEKEIKYGLAAFGNEVEQIEIKQSQKERQNQEEQKEN